MLLKKISFNVYEFKHCTYCVTRVVAIGDSPL